MVQFLSVNCFSIIRLLNRSRLYSRKCIHNERGALFGTCSEICRLSASNSWPGVLRGREGAFFGSVLNSSRARMRTNAIFFDWEQNQEGEGYWSENHNKYSRVLIKHLNECPRGGSVSATAADVSVDSGWFHRDFVSLATFWSLSNVYYMRNEECALVTMMTAMAMVVIF